MSVSGTFEGKDKSHSLVGSLCHEDYLGVEVSKIKKTEQEWRDQLTNEEYRIAREAKTERAFTGRYWDHKEQGTYTCVCCGQALFPSEAKFDSGTGWPSFSRAVGPEQVETKEDRTLFMKRTEVLCSACDAHLGHVFPDGPGPEGLRYCVNSAALSFDDGAHEPKGGS